jgi:hypothetical protein
MVRAQSFSFGHFKKKWSMNNKLKMAVIFIIICMSFSKMAFSKTVPNEFKCINSPDNKPQVLDNVLQCDLRTAFDNNGSIAKQTFGIVQRIDFASDIRIKLNPQTIMTILGEDTITFPTQPLTANIVMGKSEGKEQVLPISMKLNPVFTKTGEVCDLKFVDLKPNISEFSSPKLPNWISKGIENILNNSGLLRKKMLILANQAAVKLRTQFFFCGK